MSLRILIDPPLFKFELPHNSSGSKVLLVNYTLIPSSPSILHKQLAYYLIPFSTASTFFSSWNQITITIGEEDCSINGILDTTITYTGESRKVLVVVQEDCS